MRTRRGLLALLLAGCSLPALALELNELMTLLGRHTSGQARFSEQRFVKGFDEPLLASGTLSFTATPPRFERRTLEPRAESMVVEGNTVTLSRGGRTRTLALDAAPEALVAVEAMRGTLTGNVQALQRHFRTSLQGSLERWTLDLTPLSANAAGQLRFVRIVGLRDEVRSIETQLLDGDRTVITIEPVRGTGAAAPAR
ncbi:LolA-related protein [Azohydromonas caseinilytica]|nr:LolA-related protein [Azohydromonas caseinilytica]